MVLTACLILSACGGGGGGGDRTNPLVAVWRLLSWTTGGVTYTCPSGGACGPDDRLSLFEDRTLTLYDSTDGSTISGTWRTESGTLWLNAPGFSGASYSYSVSGSSLVMAKRGADDVFRWSKVTGLGVQIRPDPDQTKASGSFVELMLGARQ